MTYKAFLAALKPHVWTLTESGAITLRSDNEGCPWLVCGQHQHKFPDVAITSRDIWRAADASQAPGIAWPGVDYDGHDPEIRRDLLVACGLRDEFTEAACDICHGKGFWTSKEGAEISCDFCNAQP